MAQLPEHAGREGIQRLGAVQAQQAHAAVLFDLNQVFGHWISLPTGRLIVEAPLTWIKSNAGYP
jgi:hypothetical protein